MFIHRMLRALEVSTSRKSQFIIIIIINIIICIIIINIIIHIFVIRASNCETYKSAIDQGSVPAQFKQAQVTYVVEKAGWHGKLRFSSSVHARSSRRRFRLARIASSDGNRLMCSPPLVRCTVCDSARMSSDRQTTTPRAVNNGDESIHALNASKSVLDNCRKL